MTDKLPPLLPHRPGQFNVMAIFVFITTENSNYDEIEAIAREIGKIK